MRIALALGLATSLLTLGACNQGDAGNATDTSQTGEARDAAGDKAIAAGLDQNSRFFQALKSSGLDKTLAGPDPYTVLAPGDDAFAKLPAGTTDNWGKPEGRAQLTGVLTNHILPGVVLAEDIGKAIDNAKGKAQLATMGGGTLTAAREGGKIVLTDASGNKATVTGQDEKFSNGVVHRIDGVLMPAQGGAAQGSAAPAQ